MGSWALLARWRLRQDRRSAAVTAVLAGLAVGVVLAGLAGARRAEASLPAFLRYSSGADAFVSFIPAGIDGGSSPDLAAEAATVRSLPGVRAARRFTNGVVVATARSRSWRVLSWTAIDPGSTAAIGRPRILAGRLPREGDATEVAVDEELARDAHLRIGSRLPLRAMARDQLDQAGDTESLPSGPSVDATVVAIVRLPLDLRDLRAPAGLQNAYLTHYNLYLTPAFWDMARGDVAGYNPALAVDLAGGAAAVPAFADAVTKAFPDEVVTVDSRADFVTFSGTLRGVDRSVSLQSGALQLFALAAALAALLLVGQTLGRQLQAHAEDERVLRAIGMSPAALRVALLTQAGVVAAAGAVIGVVVAVALSPLTPLPGSTARLAELHPGVHADWTVLGAGAVVAAAVLALAAAVPAARRRRSEGAPVSRLAARLARAGLPVPAVVGARFALEPGRGRTAVPVRSAAVAAMGAVAFVVGAAVFAGSLDGLRATPSRYGVTWAVSAGAMSSPDDAADRGRRLAAVNGVDAFSGLATNAMSVNGKTVISLFIRPDHGWVAPRIVAGRRPGSGEIALGSATMAALGVHIGHTVSVAAEGGAPVRMRVAGRTILNAAGIDPAVKPADGALLPWSALEQLVPDQADSLAPQSFLVRLAPGADPERVRATVAKLFPGSTSPAIEPDAVANLGDVSALPLALGLVLALIGLGTVGHAMVSAVRRRRRDVAVLKCLGLDGRQVRATVACQALTFGLLAVLVGVPLGVAGGRAAWSVAAAQLSVVNRPVVPAVPVALGALAFVATVLLLAAVPGRLARRVGAATVLRAE